MTTALSQAATVLSVAVTCTMVDLASMLQLTPAEEKKLTLKLLEEFVKEAKSVVKQPQPHMDDHLQDLLAMHRKNLIARFDALHKSST